MKKRSLALFLALVMAFAPLPPSALAATNHTQGEAVSWIQARKAENWAVDYDGFAGPQCVDLILYYFDYLVGYHLYGNAYDYVGRGDLPGGWTYASVPSPGDIAVWGAYQGVALEYGHVALVESVGPESFSYVDVNGATGRGGSGTISNSNPTTFIHPDFAPAVSKPKATFHPWENSNYTYIGETDAAIGQEILISSGTCGENGIYLYDENGNFLASGKNPTYTYAKVFFQINAECGYTLMPGTTYQYRFYAVVDGEYQWGEWRNFTTEGTAPVAYPNTVAVSIDGKKVEFQMYSLKDEKGNDTSYIKIRDLAKALKGTAAQFDVDLVNGAITFTSGGYYTPDGTENSTLYSGQQPYSKVSRSISVNGTPASIDAFQITYNGGGYTYFQLRDIARKLNFNVAWRNGVVIETDKPYTGK